MNDRKELEAVVEKKIDRFFSQHGGGYSKAVIADEKSLAQDIVSLVIQAANF